jgi:exopolyphosphatase/guanosine-5'-triphosphate,3'-diphosphate pyrophosphatase
VKIAALDLGSGTIKLSVFERGAAGWQALGLDEVNTELRKGMGAERRLQPGPIADTVAAAKKFLAEAKALGVDHLPAYGTSAVRKATNPQDLTDALKALEIETRILSEEDEGRLNLLGVQARGSQGHVLVLDPGGDSSEICGGDDWKMAPAASLPFGSVSLQEHYGSHHDNAPIPWDKLAGVVADTKVLVQGFGPAKPFLGQRFLPAIRMNLPIQRAMEQVNGLPAAGHGQGGAYSYRHLEALSQAVAATDHSGRAALMDGEPLGKVDRSCYGFASWLGVLQAFEAEQFLVEPWGIKLGAALVLNGLVEEAV